MLRLISLRFLSKSAQLSMRSLSRTCRRSSSTGAAAAVARGFVVAAAVGAAGGVRRCAAGPGDRHRHVRRCACSITRMASGGEETHGFLNISLSCDLVQDHGRWSRPNTCRICILQSMVDLGRHTPTSASCCRTSWRCFARRVFKQGSADHLAQFRSQGTVSSCRPHAAQVGDLRPLLDMAGVCVPPPSPVVLLNTVEHTFPIELPLEPMLWPSLVLHLDECIVGQAAMWFATIKQGLMCFSFGDSYHRDWSDIKLALKRSHSFWKVLIEMCLIILLPYGPWKSSDYRGLRREVFDHILAHSSPEAD